MEVYLEILIAIIQVEVCSEIQVFKITIKINNNNCNYSNYKNHNKLDMFKNLRHSN